MTNERDEKSSAAEARAVEHESPADADGVSSPSPPRAGGGVSSDEQFRPDEPPPFGGSWTRLYALVLGNLLVLIVIFYLFTKAFG